MHAWVLAWCGENTGWVGLDPTNGILAGNDHVVLAIGRDYADVAPIDGVIFASGSQRIEVSVQVVPVAAAADTSVAPPARGEPTTANQQART
jgi:transglutaminase-like putative cysteine protease